MGEILPALKPIPGLTLDHPLALLTPEERVRLARELAEIARVQHRSAALAGLRPLP